MVDKKFYFRLLFIILLVEVQNALGNETEVWCYHSKNVRNAVQIPELADQVANSPIFFLETSCNSAVNGFVTLNPRQMCAVESAANSNPNSQVYVLFISPLTGPKDNTLNLIAQTHKNVHFKYVNLNKITVPVKNFWKSGRILKSPYAIVHTSDLLRYLVLDKFKKGTYLDLDVLVIKTMEKLKPNYAGAEDDYTVNGAIMNFENSSLLNEALVEFSKNYNPSAWSLMGPQLLTKLLRKLCNTNHVSLMTAKNCKNQFRVYPKEVFSPIHYSNWKTYFKVMNDTSIPSFLNNSKALHVWNKLSKSYKTPSRTGISIYGLMASKFCPIAYNNSKKYF